MSNRVHLRSGSAGPDNRAFREAIANMRLEVLEAKAETQRVRDQLNCLIMLVKRAWMGDQAAAVHVANIVGAAPPKFLRDEQNEEVSAINKNRSLHHWAMLSIGLLNRHYRRLEAQALSRAKQRLQERQDYLDQQLTKHRALLREASGRGLADVKKTSNPYLEPQKPHSSWNSRPKSSKPSPLAQPEFDYPKQFRPPKEPVVASTMMQHLANIAKMERENQHDLFSASHVVPDRSKAKRPSSGNQKLKDNQRARPKSAVIAATKGERPLKYETTHPVSGKPSSSSKPRAKSAKAASGRIFEMTEGDPSSSKPSGEDLSLFNEDERANGGYAKNGDHTRNSGHAWNSSHTRFEDTVSEGLRHMESMEEDFRKTAKMLQEKLGISGDGVI
ncbi:uncharacterized protein LOC119739431 [Patiria miniata]|uniref:Uncharacterized protein n=1 Tax=Patiria miniata TaxID=46514 RepID=A0A914B3C7_PATMI|nr:uncharacterized protein LOC119739431 [Patiria miniata]